MSIIDDVDKEFERESNTHLRGLIEELRAEAKVEIERLQGELTVSAEVIRGAPWYRDTEILQAENAKLRESLAVEMHEHHENVRDLEFENDRYREALAKIADPRLRDHTEPDAYTELGCVMNIAQAALDGDEK